MKNIYRLKIYFDASGDISVIFFFFVFSENNKPWQKKTKNKRKQTNNSTKILPRHTHTENGNFICYFKVYVHEDSDLPMIQVVFPAENIKN